MNEEQLGGVWLVGLILVPALVSVWYDGAGGLLAMCGYGAATFLLVGIVMIASGWR